MRIFGAIFASVLLAAAPCWAANVTDAVPGHPGVTYEMLLKQAMPGLKKNDDGSWDSGGLHNFRDLAGKPTATQDKPPQDIDISFKSLDVGIVRENGHKRILILTDENSGDSGFDAVLAAFDDETRIPKFLDYVDAGRDQSNGLGQVLPLSAGTDAFIAYSAHTNSNQSYEMESSLFLRGGKFHQLAYLFVYGSAACNYATTQQTSYATRPDEAAEYRALAITLTTETTPGSSDCDAGVKPLRHSKTAITDLYRWNAKTGAFAPTTGVLETISVKSWKEATQ